MPKKACLIIQLGSPKSPTTKDVKSYLKIFLSDPRLIDNVFRPLWKIVLNLFILPRRSPESAKAYKKIWMDDISPLYFYTEKFTQKLQKLNPNIVITHCYSYSHPLIEEGYKKLIEQGCNEILIVPMYPQYCEATTMSCWDAINNAKKKYGNSNIDFVYDYHNNRSYITQLSLSIEKAFQKFSSYEKVIFSYHGYPIRRVNNGDPYFAQCLKTTNLVIEHCKFLNSNNCLISFQSQFGKERWLNPSTKKTLENLLKEKIKSVLIIAPGFAVDNLETLEELGIGLKNLFLSKGGEKFELITCLNDKDEWVQGFSNEFIQEKNKQKNTQETLKRLELKETPSLPPPPQPCCLANPECKTCPNKGKTFYPNEEALSAKSKNILKILFSILFIDLVGFSIIFPLFPSLLEFYKINETQDSFFYFLYGAIESLTGVNSKNPYATITLFGGMLIFIYSLIQFIVSPFFGSLSDKFGRRPILIFSFIGLSFSYLLWIFAESFTLLVLSRVLAGFMGSNITTATAIVSDITKEKNRIKGMTIIGIAFGLGFIFGPLFGAIFSLIDLSFLPIKGINPFSAVAFFAFLLVCFNLYLLLTKLPETNLKKQKGNFRTINPIKMFSVKTIKGVTKTNFIYFIYLSAFSAAETFLTFLTFERLAYTPVNNGLMFFYVGIVLAFSQGSYVRIKAKSLGEIKLIKKGISYLIIAFLLIAFSHHSLLLFLGLTLMALGSACIIPCITSLISCYAPENEQGRILGIFRSIGALARTIGPLLGAIIYWLKGATFLYLSILIFFVPIIIITHYLPKAKLKN